ASCGGRPSRGTCGLPRTIRRAGPRRRASRKGRSPSPSSLRPTRSGRHRPASTTPTASGTRCCSRAQRTVLSSTQIRGVQRSTPLAGRRSEMELDVQELLQRYSRELAEQSHRRILAEARADAAERELKELRSTSTSPEEN